MIETKKEARTWRSKNSTEKQFKLDFLAKERKNLQKKKVEKLKKDPTSFFEKILGFKPFDYQKKLIELFEKNQFIAARWCRQSGKSWTISALILNYALTHNDCYIAVVGPSWRQTKFNIRRISNFLRKLPNQGDAISQRTKINFKNGSVIEAFPNNPDTIRGPTLNLVWWDETNFTANDENLYDSILFTLGTTDGKLVCTSTPWNTDSLFWKICNHKDFSDFARHHVSWEQAQEPNGPLRKGILEKIKRQFGEDQMRWRREMEAEWIEDEDTWLPQSLIAQCIGTEKNCGTDLQPWDTTKGYSGDLFAGLDLAQTRDYCVLAVSERANDRLFLRHLKLFNQPTKYATVIGYLKALQDRWEGFQKIRVDNTREGPSIISDMEEAGINNVEGVTFNTSRKSEMASLLKERMMTQRFFYPYLTWEKPYRGDICSEMNVERFELRRDGAICFSHPSGTHDDVWWAIALSVYATIEMKKQELETFAFG
ncbi:MAG: terminase family protein [Candidatus Bathyarchaeota archaeon]